jgi:hypothetical protein
VPEADSYRPEHTLGGAVSTAARVGWRFVDFTGLEPPGDLVAGLGNTGSRLFALAHIDPNPPGATAGRFGFPPAAIASEDLSYFGVLGFLLLVPLCAGFLVASLGGRATRARGAVAAALPLFILAIALTQSYNQWLGRFMVIPVAVAMPLTAWLYERRLRFLSLIAVVAGAATLVGTHQHNLSKPRGVWSMTRANAQTLNAGGVRCAQSLVDATVPANARLGSTDRGCSAASCSYGRATH